MKIATSFMAALLLTGTLGSMSTAMSADGVISKDELAADSYCHEKFHAMTRQSLDTDNPVINNSGAVIDFYGQCNENPVGDDRSKIKNWKPSIVLHKITRINCW